MTESRLVCLMDKRQELEIVSIRDTTKLTSEILGLSVYHMAQDQP